MNDLARVIHIFKKRRSERFVMATVIGVEGSAYRHKGAKILIDEMGKIYGTISGGCIEEDLIHQASEVLETRQPKTATYNLKSEDDLGWGQGAGCNGIIDVYIEESGWNSLIDKKGKSLWEKIDEKLGSGHRVVSVTFIGEKREKGVFYCSDGDVLYCSDGLSEQFIPHIKSFICSNKIVDLMKIENQKRVLMELYKPKELLYIFGAGPDVELLVELGTKLDFSVRVIDPRSARFQAGNFSSADQCIHEFPHIFLQENDLPLQCFVLIMTHKFEWDQYILKHFMKKPPHYLGILGPKRRTERLLASDPVPEWIHSPVGLDISAEGPEEIAISICAELVKSRSSKYVYKSL